MSEQAVPDWLKNTTYEKLFSQGEAARLLAAQGVEQELSQVVAARDADPTRRVLAHELLIKAGHRADPELAEAYCATMPEGFLHNWWGMPGQYVERLGHTMIAFGQQAVPCLTRLLDDRRLLGYFGSEEPTLSHEMQYRVCDLAAYLLGKIINVPYEDAQQIETRDEFIKELRRRLSH